MPSLENWGSGLKSISWHANSPHTPSVQTLQQTTTKIFYTETVEKKNEKKLKIKIYIYVYIIKNYKYIYMSRSGRMLFCTMVVKGLRGAGGGGN